MRDGYTKYTDVPGSIELREAICAKFKRDNGLYYTPDQVIVSCGGKQVIYNAFMATLDPGDEVIVPSATWWSSVMPILHFGGVPVFAELEGECLGLDPEDVERKITDRLFIGDLEPLAHELGRRRGMRAPPQGPGPGSPWASARPARSAPRTSHWRDRAGMGRPGRGPSRLCTHGRRRRWPPTSSPATRPSLRCRR